MRRVADRLEAAIAALEQRRAAAPIQEELYGPEPTAAPQTGLTG
jgi:hypothetical protein